MRDLSHSYLECVWLFVHEFEACLNLKKRYWISLSLPPSLPRSLPLCDQAKLHNARASGIHRWGVPVKLPWMPWECPANHMPFHDLCCCVQFLMFHCVSLLHIVNAVVLSDFPPSLFAIGDSTGQQEAGTTGLQAQFWYVQCHLMCMLACYPPCAILVPFSLSVGLEAEVSMAQSAQAFGSR